MTPKFGPAGNSDSFSAKHKSSLDAPEWLKDFGLDCYEYQCGKGVRVSRETALALGEKAREAEISLPPRAVLYQFGESRPGEPYQDHRVYPRRL